MVGEIEVTHRYRAPTANVEAKNTAIKHIKRAVRGYLNPTKQLQIAYSLEKTAPVAA